MRNIANLIKNYKKPLMIFYIVGFIFVLMIILLNNEVLGEPLVAKWIGNSTVTNHFTEAPVYSCFRGIRPELMIDDPSLFKTANFNNNHYTQSAIMLPSMFIAFCWIMLYNFSSFLNKNFH